MIRLILADDHGVVRAGIRSILEREPDLAVVAEADDGWRASSVTPARRASSGRDRPARLTRLSTASSVAIEVLVPTPPSHR